MNDSVIQPANCDEAKANRNLAIWVGVLGLGAFALFYALFFALMLLRPGLLFKLMPMPSITEAALSDGNRTYLLSQKIDMSTIDPRQQRPPEIQHFLSLLTGGKAGAEEAIPPYASAGGANGRLLFLDEGVYRTYDGSRWLEEHSEAIGKNPRGILAPAGLYVLSTSAAGPQLSLIAAATTVNLPLPADYLAGQEKGPCSCVKLALYQGKLCLFWTGKDSISWSILDGETWSPVATSQHSGGYEVIADDRNLYFFQREGEGLERKLSYSVFANNEWSGPVQLPLEGGFTNWDVFIQQGQLKLFVQQFTTSTLSTIEKGALVAPLRLKGPFDPFPMIGWAVSLFVLSSALTVLVIFGVSAGIRRFKKRIWREGDAEYEFASLFRRFLAAMLDKLLLLVPPGLIIALALPGLDEIQGNPLRFIVTIFSALALVFVGGFLYHSLLEGLYGQTLGKRICGIRVLKGDFSPCGLSAGFLRNLLRIADAFFYYLVAVIAMAANLKWQRVGDVVADTIVVKVRRRE